MSYFKHESDNSKDYKPVILITGCSSGIGLALAKLLIEKGDYRLILTAREGSLNRIREGGVSESDTVRIWPLDLNSMQSIDSFFSKLHLDWNVIDILVNNAGISYRGVVEHMDPDSELHQMQVNYLGPMALIRKALPSMRRRGRGKIINVSSVSGMLAMPTMSSYSASKYAVEGASEALWYEVKPLGINVCLVQPGFVNSNSFKNVYFSESSHPKGRGTFYKDYYDSMEPFVAKVMGLTTTTPEKVAQKIYWAIQKQNPPLRIPASPDAVFFYYLRRLLPRRLLHHVLFWMLPGSVRWAKQYTNKRPQAFIRRLLRSVGIG